jgi:hypothetical protein
MTRPFRCWLQAQARLRPRDCGPMCVMTVRRAVMCHQRCGSPTRKIARESIHTGKSAVCLTFFAPITDPILLRSICNRSLQISRSDWCFPFPGKSQGRGASSAFFGPLTRCFFAIWTATPGTSVAHQASRSTSSKSYSLGSSWRFTIDDRTPRGAFRPLNVGRKRIFAQNA